MKKKISIITIVKNDEWGILKTIDAVDRQKIDKNLIEHVIVYSKSKDNTLKNIKSYKANFRKVIFQKKKGIYDALNEGIKHCVGKYVIILHSGDIYYNNKILNNLNKNFINKDFDIIFSSLAIVDFKKKKVFRNYKIRKISNFLLRCGWMPPHEGMMIKKDIIRKHSYYTLKYKIASDFDFLIKVLFNNKYYKIGYNNNISVLMNNEGISSQWKNKFLIFQEISLILKENKIFTLKFFQIFRYFIRMNEIFFKQKIKV